MGKGAQSPKKRPKSNVFTNQWIIADVIRDRIVLIKTQNDRSQFIDPNPNVRKKEKLTTVHFILKTVADVLLGVTDPASRSLSPGNN